MQPCNDSLRTTARHSGALRPVPLHSGATVVVALVEQHAIESRPGDSTQSSFFHGRSRTQIMTLSWPLRGTWRAVIEDLLDTCDVPQGARGGPRARAPIACCSTSADGKPWLSNWASWARDLGYDYTTVAIPSGGWWLLGVGPRHYPTADRLAHDRPVLLLRQLVAQRAADQLNGIEAKVPRDFVERIESQIPLAPLDARDVPRGESDAMGERLLGEAPVPSLTPEIRT